MDHATLLATLQRFSPYLWRLSQKHPEVLAACLHVGPAAARAQCMDAYAHALATTHTHADLMQTLRMYKGKIALLTGVADITGAFGLEEVTATLSAFADRSVSAALEALLQAAAQRGEITLPSEGAARSGIVVLAMGKLGAMELNYSSDIDLIVLFEKQRLNVRGRLSEQAFMNRVTQDLVFLMQERTADGYVFRTDLRLRPDPSSMPPAVSIPAAMAYYESVGQNWERAAMIKARAIAGDAAAAHTFLTYLTPYMWRRTLDFAAIQDILSIKRQMDHREGDTPHWYDFNVKLGRGGIREIEFFVQIHQLIWGGRNPSLRHRETLAALRVMTQLRLIDPAQESQLEAAYRFWRTLEHRLQMVDDQQTHSLPPDPESMEAVAVWMGYTGTPALVAALEMHSHMVHALFTASFQSQTLSGSAGSLVFTGVTHDPATLSTLREMGYHAPETVAEIIMGWHHGNRRATRTKRAREVLTELVPAILQAFAKAPRPDESFLHFDQLVAALPAGVQLFSLCASNPNLLELLARVMSHSPYLQHSLLKHPELIEAVLVAGFYEPLPAYSTLQTELACMLHTTDDFEERMAVLRRFKNEKQFQAGVQLLNGVCTHTECGRFLADVADTVVNATLEAVTQTFEANYGTLPGAAFAVLGLGRLGSRAMTFGSDIDAVFVYDVADFEALSTGEKSFTAGVYFNRFSQRLLSALTTVTEHGMLYAVDTRLRPSGKQGLLAVSLKAFVHYFSTLKWTFEDMALTRARVVAARGTLAATLDAEIAAVLRTPREPAALAADVADMRRRTVEEFPPTSVWDLKYARGGLMDAEFIAQYLLLRYAHTHPDLLQRSTEDIIAAAGACGLLPLSDAQALQNAYAWLNRLFHWLRLTAADVDDLAHANTNLKTLVAEGMGAGDFDTLHTQLLAFQSTVSRAYAQWLEPPLTA